MNLVDRMHGRLVIAVSALIVICTVMGDRALPFFRWLMWASLILVGYGIGSLNTYFGECSRCYGKRVSRIP